MAPLVFICSSTEDKHATKVAERIASLGGDYVICSVADLSSNFHTTTKISNSLASSVFRSKTSEVSLDLNSVTSVWWRRPGRAMAPSLPEPWMEKMTQMETSDAILGTARLPQALWVNHPTSEFDASYKIRQLRLAAHIGFDVPETVITTEPDVVAEFFKQCDGKVIYKLIGERSNFEIPLYETPRGMITQPLRKADLQFLEQVRLCPHLFQRCLDKDYELRVTVCGAQVFATKIDSQVGKGKLDWRLDYSVPMEPFNLPSNLEALVLKFTRELGLNYGALDFCVEKNGRIVFLELNPSGQFLWQEKRTQQPLIDAMAKLLLGVSEPLIPVFGFAQ